jgi:hypothetical protein
VSINFSPTGPDGGPVNWFLARSPSAFSLALLVCLLAGCGAGDRAPLWPGSKYTEGDRQHAMMRALAYIAQSSRDPDNFAASGGDYMYCFYSLADTASDSRLRRAALVLSLESAKKWTKTHAVLPTGANADLVMDFASGWLTASKLGLDDSRIKPALRNAAAGFHPVDFLLFDPAHEPPPSDVPEDCRFDGAWNPRGSTVCRKCGRPLNMRSKYDVWLDALISAYTAQRYGIDIGVRYADVIQWMPTMRPYLERGQTTYPLFIDTVYSLTHVVYTLNDYNHYLLPRDLLPQEFSYLKRNLGEAIALNDPETMGEFLDSLKSFGMTTADPEIRTGITYLLDTQRADGTWSPADEKDRYTLYHSAWTGIDGLKDCRWPGHGLSFPELRPLLEKIR